MLEKDEGKTEIRKKHIKMGEFREKRFEKMERSEKGASGKLVKKGRKNYKEERNSGT